MSKVLGDAEAQNMLQKDYLLTIARVRFDFPGRILKTVSFQEGLALGINLSSIVPLA